MWFDTLHHPPHTRFKDIDLVVVAAMNIHEGHCKHGEAVIIMSHGAIFMILAILKYPLCTIIWREILLRDYLLPVYLLYYTNVCLHITYIIYLIYHLYNTEWRSLWSYLSMNCRWLETWVPVFSKLNDVFGKLNDYSYGG